MAGRRCESMVRALMIAGLTCVACSNAPSEAGASDTGSPQIAVSGPDGSLLDGVATDGQAIDGVAADGAAADRVAADGAAIALGSSLDGFTLGATVEAGTYSLMNPSFSLMQSCAGSLCIVGSF
jgi:hypothetical protein